MVTGDARNATLMLSNHRRCHQELHKMLQTTAKDDACKTLFWGAREAARGRMKKYGRDTVPDAVLGAYTRQRLGVYETIRTRRHLCTHKKQCTRLRMGLRERQCSRRCLTVSAGGTLRHRQDYAKIQDVGMLGCRESRAGKGIGEGACRDVARQSACLPRGKTQAKGGSLPKRY